MLKEVGLVDKDTGSLVDLVTGNSSIVADAINVTAASESPKHNGAGVKNTQ